MTTSPSRLHRLRRALRRFGRAQGGAAAVEFAIVAFPFIFMLMCIVELALVFMVSTSLENATAAAAREIRTGEAQSVGMTAAQFKSEICNRMPWYQSSCASKLSVDVRVYSAFSGAPPEPVSNGSFNEAKTCWRPGGPGEIVGATAWYRWQLFTPFLGIAVPKLGGNIGLLRAAAAFRNEPYAAPQATSAACPT